MMINIIRRFLVALPILVAVMSVDARVFHSKSKEKEQQAVIQNQFGELEKQIHELNKKISQLESNVASLSEAKESNLQSAKNAKKEFSATSAAKVDEVELMSKRLIEKPDSEKLVLKKEEAVTKTAADSELAEGSVESESGLYGKITSLIERKDYNKAEMFAQKYMQVFSKGENSSAVLFWLGEIRMLFGDLVEAKSFYKKSLAQLKGKGRTPEILLKIAVISYKKGEIGEGDHYYNHLQKIYPGSTASHMARAQRKKYRLENK